MSAARDPLTEGRVIGLSGAALDLLVPWHLWIGPAGRIVRAGPTVTRIVAPPGETLTGRDPFTLLDILRPYPVRDLARLLLLKGHRLRVRLQAHPDLSLAGMVVPLPGGGGAFLTLSPGAALVEIVRRFDLTLDDFAPTDLTAEMLFLIEAKSAAFRESRRLNERLRGAKTVAEAQAMTDTLTGLANRRAADAALAGLTAAPGPRFGLMHVDLDHFKAVNDTLGHAAGDAVLQEVARVLREETRRDDVVARVGGDEFLVILRDCDDLGLLDRIARRIIARLEEPLNWDGRPCRISASIGTTVSSFYDDPAAARMLEDADRATYASKSGGRARHTIHVPDGREGSMH